MERLSAFALLAAILIAGCGSGSSLNRSTSPPPHGAGLSAPIKRIALARASARRPALEPGAHSEGVRGCSPAQGQVVIVDLLSAELPPTCRRLTPAGRILLVNRTGAYDRADARTLRVELGTYRARLRPQQAALFDRPAGSYLGFGLHTIRTGAGAAVVDIQVLPQNCQSIKGHLPAGCYQR